MSGQDLSALKKLENLQWVPRWTSHVGCIKGCLDYLGNDISDAWLFGATGHAFVLNVTGDLCASGPTDWNTEMFLKLGENIGYLVEGVDEYSPDRKHDLPPVQQEAWDYIRDCIDEDIPCYGWELDVPEYYVIYGYDDAGYYISGPGCNEGKGPVPWQNPGSSEIGVVAVYSVRPTRPADDVKTIHDALSYALDHARNRWKWGHHGGLKGYNVWIKATKTGKAHKFGLAYNTAVWGECRRFAVKFLREAKGRINADLHSLFDEAIGCYATVSVNMGRVAEIYPHSTDLGPDCIEMDERAREATEALKRARDAESAGLEILSELIEAFD